MKVWGQGEVVSHDDLNDNFAEAQNGITPQQFGAIGDGVKDDTVAVQAFFNALTSSGGRGFIPRGQYLLSSTVTITIGNQGFNIEGVSSAAVVFLAAPTFSATPVLRLFGAAFATQWSLGGFAIQPSAGGAGAATTGFQIGNPAVVGINILGYHYSEIKGVQISNFATLWDLVHTRCISFVRCSGWTEPGKTNQTALSIRQNGSFTGDFVFDTCQFVTDKQTGNSVVRITSAVGPYNNTNGNCSVSGIKFNTCLLYSGDRAVDMRASNGAYLSDIWFNSVQLDQQVNYGISMISSGGIIQDIHIAECFINQATASQVEINAIGAGSVADVLVHHNAFLNPAAYVVNAYGVGGNMRNITVSDNSISDPNSATTLLEFNSVTRFSCRGNTVTGLFGATTAFHMIGVEAGSDDFIIDGNHAKGFLTGSLIVDNSGNVQKIIANNPGYNPMPLVALSVGASPYAYVNTSGAPQVVSVYGGAGIGLVMDTVPIPVNVAGNNVIVPQGKTFTVTYSSVPGMYSQGL